MDRHIDTLMDRQIERGTKRQTGILIDRQKDGKKTDRQKDRDRQKRPTKQREKKTEKILIDRQKRQTKQRREKDIWTKIQADNLIDRHSNKWCCCKISQNEFYFLNRS